MAAKESEERAGRGKAPAAGKRVAKAPAKPAAKPKAPAAPKKPAKAVVPPPVEAELEATKTSPKAAAKKKAPAPPKAPAKKAPAKPTSKPAKAPAPALDDDLSADDFDDEDGERVRVAAPAAPKAPPREDEEEAEEGETPAKKKVPIVVPPMPPRREDGTITVAYSQDADDAFMFYALESGKVDTEGRTYATVRADIQSLNEEAKKGTHDVTAISFAAYPFAYERYALLPCGGSFGDNQGPVLVAKTPVRASEVNGLVVAVPGALTTATLALRLWLPRANLKLVAAPFDQISAVVKAGKVRAGLLIHEGQLTWRDEGLVKVVDLGQWWGEKTEGLPLPLGGSAIRRDIPEELRTRIALDLKRSIAYALGHREEALGYAMKFARGLDKARLDKYVTMYVNELTLDFGERGRQATQMLLDEAYRYSFLPRTVDLDA
jgi:1,4-dihydroxy-6-naphthoate synthase